MGASLLLHSLDFLLISLLSALCLVSVISFLIHINCITLMFQWCFGCEQIRDAYCILMHIDGIHSLPACVYRSFALSGFEKDAAHQTHKDAKPKSLTSFRVIHCAAHFQFAVMSMV